MSTKEAASLHSPGHPVTTKPNQGITVAILDDYLQSSKSYFESFTQDISVQHVAYYPETIDATTSDGLSEAIKRLQPYNVISSMRERTQFPKALLTALPHLRLLMNTSTRNRSIDMVIAEQQGIIVTGTAGKYLQKKRPPDFDNTTQHTWSLILALTSRTYEDNCLLRNEASLWQEGYMVSLAGKTIGIVGLGKLGGRTARTAVLGFGMKVIAWSENLTQDKADELATAFGLRAGQFKVVTKSELFSTSDIVSLHLVMSDRTRDIVSEMEFRIMKPDSFLINTARAGLIQEEALWKVLTTGKIAGAAMDVWWTEPLASDSRWRDATQFGVNGRGRLIMSPHMGYVEKDSIDSWYREQSEILKAWLKGEDISEYEMKKT